MDTSKFGYHPLAEQVVDILTTRVQNGDRDFFRITLAYYFSKIASNMHVSLLTATNNHLPVNCYAVSFAESGYGKNYSMSILEDQIFGKFQNKFMYETFMNKASQTIAKKAIEIAALSGEDANDVEAELHADFQKSGHFLFDFSEGTSPALKQLRKPILLANAGAVSLELDEMGCTFLNLTEILTAFLELYDTGKIKEKLTKVSAEVKRSRPVVGTTPTNFFGFGTPMNVFDGGRVEDAMRNFMSIGFGRRSFFAYGDKPRTLASSTTDEIYAALTNGASNTALDTLATHFESLADKSNCGLVLPLNEAASKFLIDYQLHCVRRSDDLSNYRGIEKTEIGNRHIKASKLAGAYAFSDGSNEVTIDHLKYAIRIAEDSGLALQKLLNQPRPHVRLATFLSEYEHAVTEADLIELLPFYTGTVANKRDMMNLATAYGHRNGIAVTQYKEADVTFYRGSALIPNTDNAEMVMVHSKDIADNYTNVTPGLDKLAAKFFKKQSIHYCNHHLKFGEVGQGTRSKSNVISGFNMAIFDIDDGKIKPAVLSKMLGNVNHVIATTKSHTPADPRYRLILPMSHTLSLDDAQYKQFCRNLAFWLPVVADTSAFQREKKFRTWNTAKVWSNLKGQNIDAMQFYPSTSVSEQLVSRHGKVVGLSGIQRWVVLNCTEGQRNQVLYRYGCILAEHNITAKEIGIKITEINNKIESPLSPDELQATVLKSLEDKTQP
ncbi:primase C-terminal domain-containing protein [Crocinitomicaceae bacterium]|nr:primase C-terminal domain-containing protein [Crocinitomicaceae bacterium]